MHETDRWYRRDGSHGLTRAILVTFCLVTLWMMALWMPSMAWAQGQAEKGQPIYEQNCVSCHGADGRGGPMARMLPVAPRNLADQAYMQTRTADQLFGVIKEGSGAQGLSSAMPGFGRQLSDEQVWDAVAYVRTLAAETSASRRPSAPVTSAEAPSGDLRIQYLRVSIWPEYDDPRVLVIIRGELAPESAVPTRLRLPIPKTAELLGAGMVSAQNELLNHPHQRLTGDTSDTLELTLPVRRFFAEWYYDPFEKRTSDRQFTYPFSLPYTVAQLDVDILQPDAATEFRIEPAAMRENVNARGGRHYLFAYQDLEPETLHTFKVAYIKTTDEPSVSKPQDAASAQQTGPSRETKTWVAFAMLAGFAVIFAGGVLVFKNKRPSTLPATSTPPVPAAPQVASIPVPDAAGPSVAAQNFCPNCGRQLDTTYQFCPGCGRPLQQPSST